MRAKISKSSKYAFGIAFGGNVWMNDSGDIDHRYQYNGKELNNDHGLGWYNYGARFYDAVLGRFTSTDPLSATTPRWTPYRYGFNNPLIMTDPTGMTESPHTYSDGYGTISATASIEVWTDSRGSEPEDDYYDQNGKFLYRDNQVTDNIKIINSSDWVSIKSNYSNQLEDTDQSYSGLTKAFDEKSTLVNDNDANISSEAWSNIITNILSSMDDVNVSDLKDGRVSVYDAIIGSSAGTPEKGQRDIANTSVDKNGKINITVYLYKGSADSELRTVSNVKNVLGVHEYNGHGKKGYGDKTKDHSKAYEMQFTHST